MRRLVLAFILLVGLSAPAWADLGKGYAAYNRGDYATAFKEFKESAEQGLAMAQLALGLLYSDGQGVPQDYAEAIKWYRLAAEQGLAPAQTNLGYMYHYGRGVLQDYVQAHMWYNLAAAQGIETAAKNSEIVAKKMTSAAISKAQKLAKEWKPKE